MASALEVVGIVSAALAFLVLVANSGGKNVKKTNVVYLHGPPGHGPPVQKGGKTRRRTFIAQ